MHHPTLQHCQTPKHSAFSLKYLHGVVHQLRAAPEANLSIQTVLGLVFKTDAESSWIYHSKKTDDGRAGWNLRHVCVCGEADTCRICYPCVLAIIVFKGKTTCICCKGSTRSYCENQSTHIKSCGSGSLKIWQR